MPQDPSKRLYVGSFRTQVEHEALEVSQRRKEHSVVHQIISVTKRGSARQHLSGNGLHVIACIRIQAAEPNPLRPGLRTSQNQDRTAQGYFPGR